MDTHSSARSEQSCLFLWMVVACLVVSFAVSAQEPSPQLHPLLDPAFQLELNRISQSVVSVSDEIKLLVDGKESYPVRWEMLERAKKSIHFSTMYIFRDETTDRLGDLLIRKKKEGVDIKIIVYGTYAQGNRPFYAKMKKNGIPVKMYSSVSDVLLHAYQPKRFWLRHLHDKYLIVDGEEALAGGMNWSGRYERGGTGLKVAWRDTDMWVRGPQAAVMEKEFQKRWARDESPTDFQAFSVELEAMYAKPVYPESFNYMDSLKPCPDAPYGYRVEKMTRFLYQQPYEDGGMPRMTQFYQAVIERAKSHIYWQSISIRPTETQKKILVDAAARGVDVRMMTNSRRNMCMIPIGGIAVYALARIQYRELLEGGVRIFEYSGDAPMHAKGFLVDDVLAVIGSYNATFTAEKYYTEEGIATYDTDSIKAVKKMFDDDFAQCTEITLETLSKNHKKKAAIPKERTAAR